VDPADDLIFDAFDALVARLTRMDPSGAAIRERQHLDPFFKDELERLVGTRPVAKKLHTPHFPGLGAVDVVVSEPRALIELKWSYLIPDKIFEAVWDAIKLALVGLEHHYTALYVAAGASKSAWAATESADLFRAGQVNTIEMWQRPLVPPRSPNRGKTVGEDLVVGGRGNQPVRVPAELQVQLVRTLGVGENHELRVARIAPHGDFVEWPRIEIPATHPAPKPTLGADGSFELPRRVTQRWIEAISPALSPDQVAPFLNALRLRGWNEDELQERVFPYLPPAQ